MKNNFLVVGLGNPGLKYKNTRHNTGFLFLDYILNRYEIKKNKSFSDYIVSERVFINNKKKVKAFFMYPLTYMNNSGLAVRHFIEDNSLNTIKLIVIHDDIDMKTGKIRLKKDGGHGGHNGIKSIINELKTKEFFRLKIGIDRPAEKEKIPEYVLSPFTSEEMEIIKKSFIKVANIVVSLFFNPVEKVYSYILN